VRLSPTGLIRSALGRAPRARAAREGAFREEFDAFERLSAADAPGRFDLRWEDRHPCLEDKTPTTEFDRHYVYHTAWAARALARTRPASHVDISSYLYFATLVSAFVPVKFYDYRRADVSLSGLTSEAADLLALPFEDASVRSLSCMHVVEHVGLGRYGDPLDPNGDLKAVAELRRVLAPGGALLFVVPLGRPRVMFNAHRVYSYEQVEDYFRGLELKEFALIPDDPKDGGLIYGAARETADAQSYGCGCFWFERKGA
jgi:SAM-dependent methyltransferase